MLGKVAAYAEWRAQPAGVIPDFDDLDLPTARERLSQGAGAARAPAGCRPRRRGPCSTAVRLPLPPGGVATTAEEAVELARQLGFPVAVKLASRQLVHKTEVGGVRLNLADADAVRRAFDGDPRAVWSRTTSSTRWTACWCSRWSPAASR